MTNDAGIGLGRDTVDLPLTALEDQLVECLDVLAVGAADLHRDVGVAVRARGPTTRP